MARRKHDWNDKEDFYKIHHNVLQKYQWRFLSHVSYTHSVITDQHEELEIRSALIKTDLNSIVEIKIQKTIEIDTEWARKKARTFGYSYQAKRPSPDGRILFRYDSPHETHNKYHHKHVFSTLGLETEIIDVGVDWPHVSEFLDEVCKNF